MVSQTPQSADIAARKHALAGDMSDASSRFVSDLHTNGQVFYTAMNMALADAQTRLYLYELLEAVQRETWLMKDSRSSYMTQVHSGPGSNRTCPTYSYPVGSAASKLTMSVTQPTGVAPSVYAQGVPQPLAAIGTPTVPLVAYDGDEFSGFLPTTVQLAKEAVTLLPYAFAGLPIGSVVTALAQTILGTKTGLAILATLGYVLTR